MVEVKQEVIITTAVVVSALITYISVQSYYAWLSENKSSFKFKKAIVPKKSNNQSTITQSSNPNQAASKDSNANDTISSTTEVKVGLNKKMFQEDKLLGGRRIEK